MGSDKIKKDKILARDVMTTNNRSRTLYLIESGQVLQAALDANPELGAFPVTSVPVSTKSSGGEVEEEEEEEARGDFYGMISRANITALIQVGSGCLPRELPHPYLPYLPYHPYLPCPLQLTFSSLHALYLNRQMG